MTRRGVARAIVPTLVLLALFFAFFRTSARPDVRFACRDEAYYYYPLFQLIQSRWERGELPLWNPYDNLGRPLLADPTSSALYPGKLVFFASSLGLISFSLAFKLYIWLHVLLAFFSATLASRKIGASGTGAALAGLTYAFSGQVLFQYCNPIYLVGASWGPVLFICLHGLLTGRTRRERVAGALGFCASGALAILGGEPQIAYLAVLLGWIASLFLRKPENAESGAKAESLSRRFLRSCSLFLALSIGTGALSAVQILPSLEDARESNRANVERPRSIWEIPRALAAHSSESEKSDDFFRDMFCRDYSQGGRSEIIHRFSVGPWRWAEFAFSNIGGRQFPQSERWFEIFPGETGTWTPSLYSGAFAFILALGAFQLRGRNAASVASWLTLFGILGALGGFGLVWLFHAIAGVCNGSGLPSSFADGDPVGGLYWLLSLLAPKFSEFRYPGKLATVAVFGIALLAGRGWDRARGSRRLKALFAVFLAISACGWASALLASHFLGADCLKALHVSVNPLYGPFQAEGALASIRNAFAQTCVVLMLGATALWLKEERLPSRGRLSALASVAALILTAADLFCANSWLVATAPSAIFDRRPKLERELIRERRKLAAELGLSDRDPKFLRSIPPDRIYRLPVWFPPVFQQESSPRRIEERALWDVETLFPKYPIRSEIGELDSRGAHMDRNLALWLNSAISRANLGEELAFLGTSRVVGPQWWTSRILGTDATPPERLSDLDWTLATERVPGAVSRVSLLRDGVRLPDAEESAEIVDFQPERIVCLVSLRAVAEVVFAEQRAPGWSAEITDVSDDEYASLQGLRFQPDEIQKYLAEKDLKGRRAEIEPAFKMLRSVRTPAGKHCIVLKYRPKSVFFGVAISALAWLGFSVCLAKVRRRKTKN